MALTIQQVIEVVDKFAHTRNMELLDSYNKTGDQESWIYYDGYSEAMCDVLELLQSLEEK